MITNRVTVELLGDITQHITTSTPSEAAWVADRARAGSFWKTDQIVVVLPEVLCSIHGWSFTPGGESCSECVDYHERSM